jgi:hypothetical protein
MPVPIVAYFSPHALAIGARARGCLTCEFNQGERYAEHVVCRQQAKPRVIGCPTMGCAFWLRAVGSDD